MGASGCGPPQERSAIPFTFTGYGADRSVMRGDHLRALDVALSADLRQRPGWPCGLSLDPWMNWLAIGCRNEESAL